MSKEEILKNVQACQRYEELFGKEECTDEEVEFIFDHPRNCALDIHSFEATDRECGWPEGTLRKWNGRDRLPPPDPELLKKNEERAKRFLKILLGDDLEE